MLEPIDRVCFKRYRSDSVSTLSKLRVEDVAVCVKEFFACSLYSCYSTLIFLWDFSAHWSRYHLNIGVLSTHLSTSK